MVAVNVRSNIKAWSRKMSAIERKQVPFATAMALTRTAVDVKANFEKTAERRLDRPTRFTKTAVIVIKATKSRLIATAKFKDIQAAYLDKPERGGSRRPKKGRIPLPVAQRVNRYGNIPRGRVKQLLAKPDVFSGTVKGVSGIWQRQKKGGIKLLIAWREKAAYRPQLRFRESSRKTAARGFERHFERALAQAIRTAR